MRNFLQSFLHPQASRRLLQDEGEFIVFEVRKHWVTYLGPVGMIIGGMVLFILMPWLDEGWWLALVVGLVLGVLGLIGIHRQYMDRFVITNMRVFRVHGIFDQHMASVPIARILDISVEQPWFGRFLNFGHFVFESAAQDQGLKRIEYVPDIEERDLTIQRVIQRAGLRARMEVPDDWEDDGS